MVIENADIVEALIEAIGSSRLEVVQNRRSADQMRDLIKHRMAGK